MNHLLPELLQQPHHCSPCFHPLPFILHTEDSVLFEMQIWLGHCLCLEHFSGFSLLWDKRQNVLACSCLVWLLLPASSASIYLTLSFSLTSSATQAFMSLFLLFPVPLPQGLSTCCSLCMECSWRNLTFSTLFVSLLFVLPERSLYRPLRPRYTPSWSLICTIYQTYNYISIYVMLE